MSRVSDLIREAKQLNPELGAALEVEVNHLQERRVFGLHFERHQPEAVDLYGRPVRLGDKVRMLPTRGQTEPGDDRLWQVTGSSTVDAVRAAELTDPETGDTATHPVADLVVVAENTDVIYPGLVSTGRVERGGDAPFHTVINGENLHALKALLYTHRGKVDAIYIDPPYNTGAKDWKYNNDYVETDDLYRHSKWLAFMERRLLLAKELLNPGESVLIVTIDEKELNRLGLLLEQVFPGELTQMVTIVINPLGQERGQQLARVEEFAYFVFLGQAKPASLPDDLLNRSSARAASDGVAPSEGASPTEHVRWERLLRGGVDATRQKRPDLFYPVYLNATTHEVHSVGEPVPLTKDRASIEHPPGTITVWPLRTSGDEGRWRCSPAYFRLLLAKGYARVGEYDKANDRWSLLYLGKAQIRRIEAGEIDVLGRRTDGSLRLGRSATRRHKYSVKTVWNRPQHRAGEYGTTMNRLLIPGRGFPYPKSLYSVEDALRVVVVDKPQATILDFFAGSGTTAHAVMRLNKQDGGRRQCISVTNNEVAADEQKALLERGLRPGDPEWEALGICDFITKPRIEAAITGNTPDGTPIKGDYKFTDEFPMADGFAANAEFFTLTYEAPLAVAADHAFARIAPLLWLRAGSRGRRIDSLEAGWDVAEAYGVIERMEHLEQFLAALIAHPDAKLAFVVTDDERRFQSACALLPEGVEGVRLYESYLRNFEIDAVRSSR